MTSMQRDAQLDDLYRELIVDHYRRPRNRRVLPGATGRAEGMNPVCGDEIVVELVLDPGEERLVGLAFSGQGCSISQASASMLTERLSGCTRGEAARVTLAVRAMLMDEAAPAADLDIGDLEALQGVAKLPVRVKCALLAWNVFQQALELNEAALEIEAGGGQDG